MTAVAAKPVYLTMQDKPLDFHAASAACRELTIAFSKTHQFFVVRWSDQTHSGFSVLARRRK